MAAAKIRVERQTAVWTDRGRSYTVVLDGNKVARIKQGESITLETNPGHHELHLALDWARSPSLELELDAGQQLEVRCWSNANPFAWPYWLTLGRSRYIGIQALSDVAPTDGR